MIKTAGLVGFAGPAESPIVPGSRVCRFLWSGPFQEADRKQVECGQGLCANESPGEGVRQEGWSRARGKERKLKRGAQKTVGTGEMMRARAQGSRDRSCWILFGGTKHESMSPSQPAGVRALATQRESLADALADRAPA